MWSILEKGLEGRWLVGLSGQGLHQAATVEKGIRVQYLNANRQVDHVTRRIDPYHEAGWLPLLCSGFDFIESGRGKIYRRGFEKAIQVTKILEVLNGHRNVSST
jgi:hypothetical protein